MSGKPFSPSTTIRSSSARLAPASAVATARPSSVAVRVIEAKVEARSESRDVVGSATRETISPASRSANAAVASRSAKISAEAMPTPALVPWLAAAAPAIRIEPSWAVTSRSLAV